VVLDQLPDGPPKKRMVIDNEHTHTAFFVAAMD
jgi:hypothetical protein